MLKTPKEYEEAMLEAERLLYIEKNFEEADKLIKLIEMYEDVHYKFEQTL